MTVHDDYKDLADQALTVILGYESYLLDQITSQQLAEQMKELLNMLPVDEDTSEGLFEHLDP